MALFGSTSPAAGDLSRSQKIQMFGAMLRDAGAGLGGEDGGAITRLQTSIAAQNKLARETAAREALFNGVFGSSSPVAVSAPRVDASMTAPASVALDTAGLEAAMAPPAPRPMPSLRDVAPMLGRAMMAGVPGAKDIVELLDKTAPQMDVANGVVYDKRGAKVGERIGVNLSPVNNVMIDTQDRANADRYVPTEPAKGSRPVYDRYTGKQTGWEMMPGATDAIAASAGAEAGGRAAATAGYEMVEVPLADGRKLTMPKSQFLAFSAGGGSSAIPGLGVSQSPAEAKAAELAATTAAERAAITPKMRSALDNQARTTDLVLEKIGEALGQISGGTAGIGSLTKFIPGTAPYNLAATLETIRGNVGFDKLAEMRANSPTGGALGNVTERENSTLQSVLSSLDQGQTPEQLRSNLERVYRELSAARDARKAAYDALYAAPIAPTAPSRTPASAPASRGAGGYSVVNVRRAGQ